MTRKPKSEPRWTQPQSTPERPWNEAPRPKHWKDMTTQERARVIRELRLKPAEN